MSYRSRIVDPRSVPEQYREHQLPRPSLVEILLIYLGISGATLFAIYGICAFVFGG